MTSYYQLEHNMTTWAQRQPGIRALAAVGSRARPPTSPPWADLDLILFAADRAALLANTAWLHAIGEVWLIYRDHTGLDDPELYVLFAGGHKVDVVFAPIADPAASLEQMLAASPYVNVLRRGMRLLHPAGAVVDLGPPAPFFLLPSAVELTNHCYGILVTASQIARFLRRGDLWRARTLCEGELKTLLLTMLAWHAEAHAPIPGVAWPEGRHLQAWADPRALAALLAIIAPYEAEAVWQALFATLDLFRWLAQETAARLGYPYPARADALVYKWLRAVYAGRRTEPIP